MNQTSIIQRKYYQINNIDQTEYSKKVWERKKKIEDYEKMKSWKIKQDKEIMEVIDVSRATLFRWRKNYKELGLIGLEDGSKRPNKVRKEKWTKEIENRIYHLRIKYPLWGKSKITIAYERQYKDKISESTVGRIITKLIKLNKIKPVNFLCNKKTSKKRVFNNHAQRWKVGMKATKPGELVQIDHMTVYVEKIGYVKQFNAICPITKLAVEQVYKEATSKNAADFLGHVIKEMPFPIVSIQVDGGSEFMKEFELLCQKLNIALWVLPPKSPEYNCNGRT